MKVTFVKRPTKHLLAVCILLGVITTTIFYTEYFSSSFDSNKPKQTYPRDPGYEPSTFPQVLMVNYTYFVAHKFNFSRWDLRLQFSSYPIVNEDSIDDLNKTFQCTQQQTRGNSLQDEAGDIMCMPRPNYLPEYKNPCYRLVENNSTRCLPYFHLLGADKCGTTDLFYRITLHPKILDNGGGLRKEIYWWNWLRLGLWMQTTSKKQPFSYYIRFFVQATYSIQREFILNRKQFITGDGTPMDFWDFRGWSQDPQNQGLSEPVFLTPHAMRHVYKNPKFIIILRDPVERLYSDYIFLGYGYSPDQFAMDVPRAIRQMKNCLKENSTRSCFFSNHNYLTIPMRLHIGCYSIYLREWFSVFNRKHFHIIRTEDYHRDIKSTLADIFRFLETDELPVSSLQRIEKQEIKHKTKAKQKIGDMFPETRALLTEFYARCNEDLAALLNDQRFLWKS